MVSMHVLYHGEKRCELTHGPSHSRIETDAPKDNFGKGERFSPTDLVGAALASCILTTMAIFAEKEGLDLGGATAEVDKEMISDPRRIRSLPVRVILPVRVPQDRRAYFENIAYNCPVAKSLHPELKMTIQFDYRG